MGLATWLRGVFAAPKSKPNDVDDRGIWFSSTPSGVVVHPTEALRQSAVWACVSVISKALASCCWEVVEEDRAGNRTMRRDLPLWRKLNRQPNPEMTAFAFREAMVIQALLWGDAFAEIEWSARGDVVALWPLQPERCYLERDAAGRLVLNVKNAGRDDAVLDYDDVFHVHGPSVNGVNGLSTIGLAARTIGHAIAAEIYGSTYYGNNTRMGGILAPERPEIELTPKQVDDLRDQINARHRGADKAHAFMVLQGGLKFTPLTSTPEDSQFIETRQFVVEEICRWFGVPPHKVAHLLRASFNNIEHQGLEFVRDALTPWAERFSQEADAKLLPIGNRILTTRFDLEWLADGDALSKSQADSRYHNAGIRTANEIRRDRGWNTLADGDGLLVQDQMKPREMAVEGEKLPNSAQDMEGDEQNSDDAKQSEERPAARIRLQG